MFERQPVACVGSRRRAGGEGLMGWVCEDDGRHEGYFVAVVQRANGWQWRELTREDGDSALVRVVQAACDCGWRSARLCAPPGTSFAGGLVEIPLAVRPSPALPRGEAHQVEVQARRLWLEHTAELNAFDALWLEDPKR